LVEKGLNQFSTIKYCDIAPRVGLAPEAAGRDMKTFDIHRARIPTSMFKDIVQDLDIAMNQILSIITMRKLGQGVLLL
jgi:hypothetical protein